MRFVIVLGWACSLGAGEAGPGEPPAQHRLEQARTAFQLGVQAQRQPAEARDHFAQAAADLEPLSGPGRSPAFFLGLGNAEALAGRWPQAIWAYHCGLKLDPNNADLHEHLETARSLVNYPSGGRGRPKADTWPAWLHRPTSNEWLVLAVGAWALACFAFGVWHVRRGTLGLAVALGLLVVAGAAGTGYLLDAQRAQDEERRPLLIVLKETPLHTGNGSSYPLNGDVPSLPAGLEIYQQHVRGGWAQVELSTGEIGWVPRATVWAVEVR